MLFRSNIKVINSWKVRPLGSGPVPYLVMSPSLVLLPRASVGGALRLIKSSGVKITNFRLTCRPSARKLLATFVVVVVGLIGYRQLPFVLAHCHELVKVAHMRLGPACEPWSRLSFGSSVSRP